jgi:hypothetical protein
MTETAARSFLTAEWRFLAMLHWQVERPLFQPLVPAGTELHDCNGKLYASVVGIRSDGSPSRVEYSRVHAGAEGRLRLAASTGRRSFEADVRSLYGDRFASALERPPDVAFLAAGSAIRVRRGTKVAL